jgi:hypothetical protein
VGFFYGPRKKETTMTEERVIRTSIEPLADAGEETAEPRPEGGTDAPETTPDPAADAAESAEAGGGADEPGKEAGANGEGDEGSEGEAGAKAGDVNPVLQSLEALHKRMDKMETGRVGTEDGDEDMEKQVLVPEFNDAAFADVEERYGFTKPQVTFVRGMLNQVAKSILKQVQGSTAGYRKDQAMSAMASAKDAAGKPLYPGISSPQYRASIDEFLKDYNLSIHSRKEILDRAFWFAKGKHGDKAVESVRKGKEINRTIAGKTKLATPTGGVAEDKTITLSSTQKLAARYHPQGEKGYIQDLRGSGRGVRKTQIEATA